MLKGLIGLFTVVAVTAAILSLSLFGGTTYVVALSERPDKEEVRIAVPGRAADPCAAASVLPPARSVAC